MTTDAKFTGEYVMGGNQPFTDEEKRLIARITKSAKKGGAGSGNFNHESVIGHRGGSAPSIASQIPSIGEIKSSSEGVKKQEVKDYLKSKGYSDKSVNDVEHAFTQHSHDQSNQIAGDKNLTEYWNDPDSEQGQVLREYAQIEQAVIEKQQEIWDKDAKSVVASLNEIAPDKMNMDTDRELVSRGMQLSSVEDWYYNPITEPEEYAFYWQGKYDDAVDKVNNGLTLYRASPDSKPYNDSLSPKDLQRDVLSFTTFERGAETSAITNPGERLYPNTYMPVKDLPGKGYTVLSGIGVFRGYSAESEVIVIKTGPVTKGNANSGNHGHAGRLGIRGGSAPGDGGIPATPGNHEKMDYKTSPIIQRLIHSENGVRNERRRLFEEYHLDRREDAVLAVVVKERGFDAHPSVLPDEDFDKLVEESPYGIMYRGVNDGWGVHYTPGEAIPSEGNIPGTEYIDQFRNGNYFAGSGLSGNGTYFAANPKEDVATVPNTPGIAYRTAFAFGGKNDNNVMEAVLKPDSRVIKDRDLRDLHTAFDAKIDLTEREGRSQSTAQTISGSSARQAAYYNIREGVQDDGVFAAYMGYDAIHVTGSEYVVVLNRGALCIPERTIVKTPTGYGGGK